MWKTIRIRESAYNYLKELAREEKKWEAHHENGLVMIEVKDDEGKTH